MLSSMASRSSLKCGQLKRDFARHRYFSRHHDMDDDQLSRIRTMLRINLAGEVAANRIYEGQKRIFRSDGATIRILEEMHQQEIDHLEKLKLLAQDYKVRASALTPLAHALPYFLGIATALMGKGAAMTCTEAVETVVADHYNSQLREMASMPPSEPIKRLRDVIKQLRDEELEHKAIAEANDSGKAPCHSALSWIIQRGCRAAILAVSKL